MENTTLYHALFCPFSRKIVLGLKEKQAVFQSRIEKPWHLSPNAKRLSLLGTLPILSAESIICAEESIIHAYIDDAYKVPCLGGSSLKERTHIRHIVTWFEKIFYPNIYKKIVYERAFKGFHENKSPDPKIIRSALFKLQTYLVIIDRFCETDTFIVGNAISWADIVAASHLSCIDYMIDIPWNTIPFAKRWYMKIKSRPSFQFFLKERLHNITPCKNYDLLDF